MRLFFILLIIPWAAMANVIRGSFNPAVPLVNEPFRFIVEVESTINERPYVSFNPVGAEVTGRSELGSSVQTSIINGQISTRRIVRISYDMLATSAGQVRIRDLKAELGREVVVGPDLTVNVVTQRAAPSLFFVKAEATKTEIYSGEGINVDYYLYFRVPLLGLEIQDFPRLNNFIKRFHMTNDSHETVEYEGTLYRRRKAYSARLYPERLGEIVVDPIRLRIQYTDQPSGGLGGFGGIGRHQQTRSIISEEIIINVRELPLDNVPKNFTGLVGNHQFELSIPRTRFVINEVVELQLKVVGDGALEHFGAPQILSHPNLEAFDTKSDFREINNQSAQKVFNYTFIARGGVDLKDHKISLSYFDPNAEKFREVELVLPELFVSPAQVGGTEDTQAIIEDSSRVRPAQELPVKLNAPYFYSPRYSMLETRNLFKAINVILLALLALCVALLVKNGQQNNGRKKKYQDAVSTLRRNGLSYEGLFRVFTVVMEDDVISDLSSIIDGMTLSVDAKKYFKGLVSIAEKENYKNSQATVEFNFEKRYFKELINAQRSNIVNEESNQFA
jgi:hypothetical protein